MVIVETIQSSTNSFRVINNGGSIMIVIVIFQVVQIFVLFLRSIVPITLLQNPANATILLRPKRLK